MMHLGIKELDKPFARALGAKVAELSGEPDGKLRNRRKLFFEVEPFAREFGEYPKDPIERDNYDEYAEWINRKLNGVKSQGLQIYRAMFFA